MTTIETITEAIETDIDFYAGGEDVADVAAEWFDRLGADAESWINSGARCFTAEAAADLRAAGMTLDGAAVMTEEGAGGYKDTVGYKVANGDLGIGDAITAAIRGR